MPKTSTKRKAISKKEVIDFPEMGTQVGKLPKDWGKIKVDGKLVDFNTMLEVPTPKELGMHRGNNKMTLTNKITLILTVVNVAILISLVIKNV